MEILKVANYIELKPKPDTHTELISPESPLYSHMSLPWNPDFYAYPRGPIEIAAISPEVAAKATKVLPPELSNIRSMPIKRPGMEAIVLPKTLENFAEMVQQVADYQEFIRIFREKHAYLTINQGLIAPNQTQRIPGVHVDGLQAGQAQIFPPEQSYSCAFGELQTLFYPNQSYDFYGLPADKRAYAEYIKQVTDVNLAISSKEGVLHLWDSYTPHATPANTSEEAQFRTFFRIEFSDRQFDGPDAVTGTHATPNPFLK